MRNRLKNSLFATNIFIFIFFCCKAQVNETFSDGNLYANPEWIGDIDAFIVNTDGELQLNGSVHKKKAQIATSSACDLGAEWEIDMRMECNPSNQNKVEFYILSVSEDLIHSPNAYYVVVGNNADEVSLYSQSAASKTKMIDGTNKRLDRDIVDVKVKVELSKDGEFILYSKLADEVNYVEEGRAQLKKTYETTRYLGIVVTYSSKNTAKYFFRSVRCTCPEVVPDDDESMPPDNSSEKNAATEITGEFFVETDVYYRSTSDFYISYVFSQPDLVANITTFDATGNIIERVANNITLNKNDGRFKLNADYPSGIAIIYAEVHTKNGKVKRWKIPIVCGK